MSALTSPRRTLAALASATLVNLPFGTIYAFSVFLVPVERSLGVGRAEMTSVFALATISLTAGMIVSPRLYRWIAPSRLALACGACACAGMWTTAFAGQLWQFALGYGVMFGFAGGVAFILVQQAVNLAVRTRLGLVNGYVVSLYPLGAMIGAPLFGWLIAAQSVRFTLVAMGVVLLATHIAAAQLLRAAAVSVGDASAPDGEVRDPRWCLFSLLFAVFFLAAAAGLTVMSQVAGIVRAYGGEVSLALAATSIITGLIAAARLTGGWLLDHFPVPWVASGAHLWSLAGAAVLLLFPGPLVAVPALAMIGMGYGFISGVTAGAIARYWDRGSFGVVAGRLYIAWCMAALSLPVLAGWLYDRTQGYAAALAIAAAGNVLGAIVAQRLPARGAERHATTA